MFLLCFEFSIVVTIQKQTATEIFKYTSIKLETKEAIPLPYGNSPYRFKLNCTTLVAIIFNIFFFYLLGFSFL